MAALAVVLTLSSGAYGYHRDELYFRMLPPAWGHLDQPPLTPLLARGFSSLLADEVWALRIPATLAAVASVWVVTLITRELGGGRGAQLLCAWSYAFASSPLLFGHVLLTATLDLLIWPAVVLCVLRAVLRSPKWWLAAGAVAGASLYNKWLVIVLLLALVLGLLTVGPRRVLWSRWPWMAAVAAAVIGAPNIVYQLTHDWPQLRMGAGLGAENAAEVRIQMWPFLALLLGPPLVPVWIAGWVALGRRPGWHAVRFLAVAFPVVLAFTFVSGTQPYYPVGMLVVLYAAGCIPAAALLSRLARPWQLGAFALLALNAVVSAVIALPVLPVRLLGGSPVPGISQLAADQVGWPAYVQQVADVYRSLPAGDRPGTALVASNYGEAGAIARYGPRLGLPAVYSGHNQLYEQGQPPPETEQVIIVGGQGSRFVWAFASCRVLATLDNGVGVDNEEQGQLITLCRGPRDPWSVLWPRFRHLD